MNYYFCVTYKKHRTACLIVLMKLIFQIIFTLKVLAVGDSKK